MVLDTLEGQERPPRGENQTSIFGMVEKEVEGREDASVDVEVDLEALVGSSNGFEIVGVTTRSVAPARNLRNRIGGHVT